jgi:uncharacterized protein YndB with AHSA1/START domain
MANEYDEIVQREIVTTRVLDVPRQFVFASWTDPEQLKLWWGPHGFTNTFHHFEMKPGGMRRYTMHGPDGTNYENEMEFIEIDEPARIVIEHRTPPHFRLTVLFEELGERTKITWRQLFETEAVRDAIKGRALQGNEDNLDRLVTHVAGKRAA